MRKLHLFSLLLQEKHGKAYELGYFIGSKLFYVLLFICVVVALFFILKSLRKKNTDE